MGISTNKFIVSLCNGYNKIANFIRKDKDVISVIISFFVGVGSIIVGCVTISVSNQQVILTNRQVELQELLEQPIFRIEYDFVDTYDDEVTYYDTKVANVYNDGTIPRLIQRVDVDEILKFSRTTFLIVAPLVVANKPSVPERLDNVKPSPLNTPVYEDVIPPDQLDKSIFAVKITFLFAESAVLSSLALETAVYVIPSLVNVWRVIPSGVIVAPSPILSCIRSAPSEFWYIEVPAVDQSEPRIEEIVSWERVGTCGAGATAFALACASACICVWSEVIWVVMSLVV